MKKFLILLIGFLLVINISFALDEYRQNENVTFGLFNQSQAGQIPLLGATCNITIRQGDNGTVVFIDDNTTEFGLGYYGFKINTSLPASYSYYTAYADCTWGGGFNITLQPKKFLVVNITVQEHFKDIRDNLTDVLENLTYMSNWESLYFTNWNTTIYEWNGTTFVNFANNFTMIQQNFSMMALNFSRVWTYFGCGSDNNTVCNYMLRINETSYLTFNQTLNLTTELYQYFECTKDNKACRYLYNISASTEATEGIVKLALPEYEIECDIYSLPEIGQVKMQCEIGATNITANPMVTLCLPHEVSTQDTILYDSTGVEIGYMILINEWGENCIKFESGLSKAGSELFDIYFPRPTGNVTSFQISILEQKVAGFLDFLTKPAGEFIEGVVEASAEILDIDIIPNLKSPFDSTVRFSIKLWHFILVAIVIIGYFISLIIYRKFYKSK